MYFLQILNSSLMLWTWTNVLNALSTRSQVFKSTNLVYFKARNENRPQRPFQTLFFNYLPSSGIASCVVTAGTVMWCLHLTRPCCVALGQVLIWVMSLDWLRSYINIEHAYSGYSLPKRDSIHREQKVATVFEHCCCFTP